MSTSKQKLQHYCDAQVTKPLYTCRRDTGPAHTALWRAKVYVGRQSFEGCVGAASKRKAEQEAARVALLTITGGSACLDEKHPKSELLEWIREHHGDVGINQVLQYVHQQCRGDQQTQQQQQQQQQPGTRVAVRVLGVDNVWYQFEGYSPTGSAKEAQRLGSRAALEFLKQQAMQQVQRLDLPEQLTVKILLDFENCSSGISRMLDAFHGHPRVHWIGFGGEHCAHTVVDALERSGKLDQLVRAPSAARDAADIALIMWIAKRLHVFEETPHVLVIVTGDHFGQTLAQLLTKKKKKKRGLGACQGSQ